MVRTGKSGRYRYYACASHRLKGKVACSNPVAIRESQLDDMVLTALAGQLITPGTSLPCPQAPARKFIGKHSETRCFTQPDQKPRTTD